MEEKEKDNIAGFAIDRDDMDMLLTKWFGGNYLDIVGWKEKAELYDIIQKTKPEMSFTKAICYNCNRGSYPYHCAWNLICEECSTNMKEKAKNWDQYVTNELGSEYTLMALVEKAKKWDDIGNKEYWERVEKAKKYDEFNSTYGYDLTLMKAKKYDELKRILDPMLR